MNININMIMNIYIYIASTSVSTSISIFTSTVYGHEDGHAMDMSISISMYMPISTVYWNCISALGLLFNFVSRHLLEFHFYLLRIKSVSIYFLISYSFCFYSLHFIFVSPAKFSNALRCEDQQIEHFDFIFCLILFISRFPTFTSKCISETPYDT